MPIYDFNFPRKYAGRQITITGPGGPYTATLPAAVDGVVTYSRELADGVYAATDARHRLLTYGRYNITATIEAAVGSGVAADETAFFVATGPTMASDGSTPTLTLVADSRHGDLPSWASIVDGAAVLGVDAGTCAFSLAAQYAFDFSGTTHPSGTGTIAATASLHLDGALVTGSQASASQAGDGGASAVLTAPTVGGLILAGTVELIGNAYADEDGVTTIDDAVVTPKVALTITRIAQAAMLPD